MKSEPGLSERSRGPDRNHPSPVTRRAPDATEAERTKALERRAGLCYPRDMRPLPALVCLGVLLLAEACGAPPAGTDAGPAGVDAGPAPVSSSGTAGGRPVRLQTGAARVTGQDLLLVLTDQSPWQCPSTASQTFKPGEVSLNLVLTAAAGTGLVGTFPLFTGASNQPVPAGQALGFVVVAPTTCPASVGDGTRLVGGSLTLSSATGTVTGSFTAQVQGGESITGQFAVPACAIAGITGQCNP